MLYSKLALLLFGGGLVLGLAVVAADLSALARLASLAMAAGITLLPLAVVADCRRAWRRPGKRGGKPTAAKRRAAPVRRRARTPAKRRAK